MAEIQVVDTQTPLLMCPNNVVAGYCNPIVFYQQPQVLDNCAVNLQQLQLVSGLPSGSNFPAGLTNQTFRYTDGAGNIGECTFSVSIHLAPSVNASVTNVTCGGLCNGIVTINVTGGQTPFGIVWNNGGAGPAIGNLCPGAYMATVTDGDGCQQIQSAQVTQPDPLLLSSFVVHNDPGNAGTGSINIVVQGGMMPYTYNWMRNGQSFASTQNLFSLFVGQYAVVVTDANGCTYTSIFFNVNNAVATTEPENNFQWSVFPNPAQTEVFLKMDAAEAGNARVSIFDSSGRLLLEQDATPINNSSGRIDLSGLPDGMLLLRLANDQGIFSKRLVKAAK